MNKSKIARAGFAGLIVVLTGCSSADEGGTTGGSSSSSKTPAKKAATSGTTDQDQTSTDETTPAPVTEACVPVGTKGNSIGVGAYCQKAADCPNAGAFCTAGQAPKGAEFCTAFCAVDSDCGEGAKCYAGDPRGKGCVPIACLPKS